jgi:2-iminobutanoate/2-iminopropanoate deaminase
MTIFSVTTENAPQAIGPYSQAVRQGELIFASGQIPIDPATNQLVPGDITAQTRQVLTNLRAVLEASESGMTKVLKTTVFLTDLADFEEMNAVYAEAFGDHRPARSTVQVAALPKSVRIEIDVIAVRG